MGHRQPRDAVQLPGPDRAASPDRPAGRAEPCADETSLPPPAPPRSRRRVLDHRERRCRRAPDQPEAHDPRPPGVTERPGRNPGSSLKDFSQVLTQVTGRRPGDVAGYPPATITTDQAWFDLVVDRAADTPQYRALLADLEILAANLSYFAAYDILVLLRPYHEMNGAWFWWGGKTPASYKKLWAITYDYLVKTRGLHNLIFVWSPNAWTPNGNNVPWNYYPGADRVDVVAVDDYNARYGSGGGTPESPDYTNIYYRGLADYAKPRMLAETGYVPITARTDTVPATNALDASPWVWNVWGTGSLQGTRTRTSRPPTTPAARSGPGDPARATARTSTGVRSTPTDPVRVPVRVRHPSRGRAAERARGAAPGAVGRQRSREGRGRRSAQGSRDCPPGCRTGHRRRPEP